MLPESFTPEFLRQLELFKLQSRRTFLGSRQGGHISVRRGHGIEFSDYRQYELGDNPRHIDWSVYARTDRLYIKRFQEEEDLSVLVILDTSASMITPSADKKWEMARDIAIALSYVALMQQDTVYVSALGQLNSPAYFGARAIHSLSRDLSQIDIGTLMDFQGETMKALSRIRFPGIAFVLSDFLMPFAEIEGMFNALRAKNLQIVAVQILGGADIEPLKGIQDAVVVDSETGEEMELSNDGSFQRRYTETLNHHIEMIREFFLSAGISYVRGETTQTLSEFVIHELPRTGLLK